MRKLGRAGATLFALAFGLFLILFCKGWTIKGAPAPLAGYLIIGVAVLAMAGVNVWYGGPLDKRKDYNR